MAFDIGIVMPTTLLVYITITQVILYQTKIILINHTSILLFLQSTFVDHQHALAILNGEEHTSYFAHCKWFLIKQPQKIKFNVFECDDKVECIKK